APADQGADLEGPVDTYLEVGAPADRRLAVGEGRHRAGVEQDRGAVGGDGDPAGAGERGVEQAARGHSRALDPPDVPVDVGLEGEQVAAVDGQALVLQVDQVDVRGGVGEVGQALTARPDERRALAGHRLRE